MEQNKVIGPILAIDSISRRGSLAVVRGSSVLASSNNTPRNPSRAEEMLSLVTEVLATAEIGLEDLAAIAVATGPGSYSGIRIGMATAMGFSNAHNIPALGVTLLSAIAMTAHSGVVTAAVRAGKNDVAYETFEITNDGPRSLASPVQDSETNFIRALSDAKRIIVCDSQFAEQFPNLFTAGIEIRISEHRLASLIGLFAARFPNRSQLRPMYLRNLGHENAGF